MTRTGRARAIAVLVCGLAGGPAAAQEAVGMKLEDAGFVMREANTPEKMVRLRQLPAHKFLTRTGPAGRYFLYADPSYCKCVFVGTPAAMQSYRNMVSPPPTNMQPFSPGRGDNLTDELMAHDLDNDLGPLPSGDFLDYRF